MRKKLQRFQAVHAYDRYKEFLFHDRNHHPWIPEDGKKLIVELGCGYGEYSLELAQGSPDSIVVGVDVKGDRLYKALKVSEERDLLNTRFVRMDARRIADFFPPESVDNLWITFPDPFLGKQSHAITAEGFMELYSRILAPSGKLFIVTDSLDVAQQSTHSTQQYFSLESREVPLIVRSRYYESKVKNGVVYTLTYIKKNYS